MIIVVEEEEGNVCWPYFLGDLPLGCFLLPHRKNIMKERSKNQSKSFNSFVAAVRSMRLTTWARIYLCFLGHITLNITS